MIRNGNPNNYVLIIGSSNMDLNIYSTRLPKPGETVTGGIFKQFLGGKGANQSVASVRSGADTFFIGKIGNDNYGDQMIDRLHKEGINTDFIIRDSLNHSGVAFILIDNYGENMISVAPGSNSKLHKKEIKKYREIIMQCKVLVVQMEIPIETISIIFNIASKGGAIKILNPAPLKPIPKEILKNIDIIIPNEGELFQLHTLLGYKPFKNNIIKNSMELVIKASKDIGILGLKFIITTLGSRGCLIYDVLNDKTIKLPSYKVNAKDTVGAGDCFNGVLASQLCKGKPILNAVKYAICAASIAVTREGAQESMPFLNEIKERVIKYNNIVNL